MEEKRNVYSISKEDMNLSFEGITQIEKRFLNIVRKYRSQIWLHHYITNMFEDLMTEAMETSVEHVVLSSFIEEAKEGLKSEDALHTYHKISDSVAEDEELMEEMANDWNKVITDTILGDLIPLDKEEVDNIETLDK